MEEDLKTLKVDLDYYDQDGKHSLKTMSIKVNKLKDMSEKGFGWTKKSYEMTFSLTIPDHIHKELLGKTIPERKMSHKNGLRSYVDFSKTINSETVKGVCDRYWEIIQDYLWLKNIEKSELKKVIFFNFENSFGDYKSDWDGSLIGRKNKINYSYSVGFISDKNVRYNVNKLLIDQHHTREFYNWQHIEWTEEREMFFNNIQKSFENIIDKINSFNNSINEETINILIKNSSNLLSS